MVCEIWCDGSVINNGPRTHIFYGIIIKYKGIENSQGGYCGEYKNNNNVFSEYKSIEKALEYINNYSSENILIYTDCRPVIKDINERNKPFKDDLSEIYNNIVNKLENNDKNVQIIGIDRKDNKKADQVCEKAKYNFKNKEYLEKSKKLNKEDIIKVGKSKFKIENHIVNLNSICSCYEEKGWDKNSRHTKKCEHEFLIDKYLGFTSLHP